MTKFKKLGVIAALSSLLLFTGCTPEEQALATGVAVGGTAVALSSYSYPRYYDQPYYYHNNRYYYGGYHQNGYYHHGGNRYSNGHYYNNGYRHYNGQRYRAVNGQHGHYSSRNNYQRSAHYKNRRR
ncbi:MAG: hypothetical protein U9Q90_08930 [Campylobacterota bacterium]|nr:hypothetical protein [Campylobacterota bacterium]